MAYDPSQFGSTTPEYATPQQLQQMQALSNSLISPQQHLMVKPWQGATNIANALIGGYFGNLADQKALANANQSGQGPNIGVSQPLSPASAAVASAVSGATGQPLNMADIQPSSSAAALMPHAIDQLRQEGVPEQNLRPAAAHLVGQADAESGFNPNLTHDGGIGYGLYGANGDRLKNMRGWLQANGYAQNSAEGQMRYMAHEAMTDPKYGVTRGILMGATPETLQAQTRAVTGDFERPKYINDRRRAVLSAYQSYQPNQGQ